MRHVVVLAMLLVAGRARAEPRAPTPTPPVSSIDGDVVMVDVPPGHASVAHTIYLDRCASGCTVRPGDNDARNNTDSVISQTAALSPFAYSDASWNAVVACVRETYAPYDVSIVTDEPPTGTDYIKALVAGTPDQAGQPATTLGVSPMARDCSPQTNWISLVFANAHGDDPIYICATVAHETGHIYGLDHTLDCKDPMTYLNGCGQKHFLNLAMQCGEFGGARTCKCTGDTIDTHVILTNVLGPGTPPPPPVVAIPYPHGGDTVGNGFLMFGKVTEDRVVDRVEFWLNGFPWSIQRGSRDTDTYQYRAPDNLPDGVIDLEVKAYDDLQQEGSAELTITKNQPCTDSSQCLDGQSCNAGACAWPPPTVALGGACSKDADCETFRCANDGQVSLCTQYCVFGVAGSCPADYTCLNADGQGVCWPSDLVKSGGCCDSGGPAGGPLVLGGLVALLSTRKRKAQRRRSRATASQSSLTTQPPLRGDIS